MTLTVSGWCNGECIPECRLSQIWKNRGWRSNTKE